MNNWFLLTLAIAAVIAIASFLDGGNNNQNGFTSWQSHFMNRKYTFLEHSPQRGLSLVEIKM